MIALLLAPGVCLAAAGTDAPEGGTAPAAAGSPAPADFKYSAEITGLMKDLSILLERGPEIPPDRMGPLAPEISRLDGLVKTALGAAATEAAPRNEKYAESDAGGKIAEEYLRFLRSALQVYYAANNGKYPKTLSDLVPAQIPALPELYLPGHQRTDKVIAVNSKKYDKDFSKAVTDSGGWLYFADPSSANYGLLVIDCRHADADGVELFRN